MARLAGVDLPSKKRTEIGLTYIYGIGRTRSKSLCYLAGVDPNKKVSELTEDEINHIRQILEAEGCLRPTSTPLPARPTPIRCSLTTRLLPPTAA